MIFTTWIYGSFLFCVVTVFWTLPVGARPWWLIAAGLLFYSNYYPPHLGLVVGVTALVYAAARLGASGRGAWKRAVLTAGIVLSLGLLAYYKYTGLTFSTVAAMGLSLPPSATRLVPMRAPLAVSFFVFEYVHYLIEVRRGTIAPGRPRDFALFILFFPTLISGPIKRFAQFQPQIELEVRPDHAEMSRGLERIVFGLSKKVLVADTIARFIGPLWSTPLAQSSALLWLATYGYAMQILFDFSGYSDIAIGSARLLGFRVPENFHYPYFQENVARFWRSWHMSLTSWITDYVYVPLGGNRRGLVRTHLNRLGAMALVGLWHGAAGHFVLWGIFHGVGLNVYHAYRSFRRRLPRPEGFGLAGRLVGTLITFHFVCIGWVFFVLDAPTATKVVARLFGLG